MIDLPAIHKLKTLTDTLLGSSDINRILWKENNNYLIRRGASKHSIKGEKIPTEYNLLPLHYEH